MSDNAPVLTENREGTLLVTLNQPEARNAIGDEMREALADVVVHARDNAAIRVVVFTGIGDHFCAGGNLSDLKSESRSPWESRERIRRLHYWFRDLVALEKPVIAAVNGACYGAGFSLALASDFILCEPSARFCAVFGRIGVVPDLGSLYMLPRIVGLQRAKQIMFTAREIRADEALDLGIAYAIRPAETLLPDALDLAAEFHQASPEAIGMTKSVLNQSFNLDQNALIELEASTQAIAFASAYHHIAVQRFFEKEKPIFPGRDLFPDKRG